MRYDSAARLLELTERNITALLDKLDDALSERTLICGNGERLVVTAREDEGPEPHTATGALLLSRSQLRELAAGRAVDAGGLRVVPVDDAAHYGDRAPGVVYMPGTGEYR